MGDGNVMAQMLSSLTIAFYFFAQFIFGVIFMFTGFSYTGDNFCTLPVNGTLLDDPNKLLGPTGAIVEWNKIMGIVLVTSSLVVTIVCTSISVVESYLQKHTSVAKHVTLFLIACLSFVQFVLTCLGMNYILLLYYFLRNSFVALLEVLFAILRLCLDGQQRLCLDGQHVPRINTCTD